MNAILWIHVAGGLVALLAGTAAIAVRKGGRVHGAAGTWFCIAMLVLGATAAILSPLKTPAESPLGGIMVCYFVATAWSAARRRSGTPGRFDRLACAIVLVIAASTIAHGVEVAYAPPGKYAGPPGPFALFALGAICLLAGALDLRFIVRGTLTYTQRLSRHLWRMCFAFFIATGSFFLGQQDVLPAAMRGTAMQWLPAFAPFAVMVFWLIRVRRSRKRRAQTA